MGRNPSHFQHKDINIILHITVTVEQREALRKLWGMKGVATRQDCKNALTALCYADIETWPDQAEDAQ